MVWIFQRFTITAIFMQPFYAAPCHIIVWVISKQTDDRTIHPFWIFVVCSIKTIFFRFKNNFFIAFPPTPHFRVHQ